MQIDIMTLFPEVCESVLSSSIVGRARTKGIIDIACHQIRDYTLDKHRRVDDSPYGGGKGMLMMAEPIASCFEHICKRNKCRPLFIYMSPKGDKLTQQIITELSNYDKIAVLCGHYEGVDNRVLEKFVDKEISIGDYVLTGGELPALVLVDALARMVPGVLSCKECVENESHYNGLLEYPQYTRPYNWRGLTVPEVLISGNHKKINEWKQEKSYTVTKMNRPDMIKE